MADPPRQDDATRSLLLEQFAVEQFLLGLSLVDRFLLDVLIVPTPRVARAVLALLRDELPARRAEPLDVRVFAPDPAKASALDPVEASALMADVLTPLLQPAEPTAGRMTLTWLDASDARAIDDEAWTEFFHRLNERRNAVVESQPGPLVLVLPYRLERTLAHAAPDVWSVRSGVYRVQVVDLETHVFDVETERHRPIGAAHAADSAPRSLTLAIALTGEEPARFDDKTRAWVFSETVSGLVREGRLAEAESIAQASLERARRIAELSPGSNQALRTLTGVLDELVDLAHSLGDKPRLREVVRERLAIIDQMTGEGEPVEAVLRLRARARAFAAVMNGEADLALALSGLDDARRLVAEHGSTRDNLRLLAECLLCVAELEMNLNHGDEALSLANEALACIVDTSGSLVRSPSKIYTLEIEIRILRARALSRLNRHDEAISDARVALDQTREIQRLAPRWLHCARLVSLSLRQLAHVYRRQGDLTRATDSLTELRKVATSMFRSWPQSILAAYALLSALQESAEVAHEAGSPERAALWTDEALSLAASLAQRLPTDESVRSKQAALLALQHHLQPLTDPT
ncbi:MAG: hypothetical protein Q8S73_27265 [Deltaproteobacteria bacterium]|nr:hypothetical protein [Myxococcales bacterium]MDP3217837.1 hypothetical protein [Deltaproteobacteria bacterium]